MTRPEILALERGLPAAPNAERDILAQVIVATRIPPEAEHLRASDFTSEDRRIVWRTMTALADMGRPVTEVTLAEILERRGDLSKLGGFTYLASLVDAVPALSSATIRETARIVRDKATRRRLFSIAGELADMASTSDESAAELIDLALSRLEAARPTGEVSDVAAYTVEALDREYSHHVERLDENRIRLGLERFDDAVRGVGFGEVVTIMARTGVGKSAIAQNIINHVLEHCPGAGIVFFSAEMPRLQAYERQMQVWAGVCAEAVQYGFRNDRSRVGADEFAKRASGRLLIVDDTRLDLGGLKRLVRGSVAAKLIQPVRLLVIDYLGLLDRGGKASLTERVSMLAREVKQVAKQLETVVLLIAQTSRSAGDGSEPVSVVDARDSGAIEDSADFLLGAWRPALKKGIAPEEFRQLEKEMHFAVLKARRGAKERFTVQFEARTLRVS